MNEVKQTASAQNDEIDIGEIIQSLWAGKWLIMSFAFICAVTSIAYVFMAQPIYSGNALLQIEAKSSGITGLSDLTSGFGGGLGGSETSTELELLRSRKVIIPTIEKFNMQIQAAPLTFPVFGGFFQRQFGQNNGFAQPLWSSIFPFSQDYAWGGESINVVRFDLPQNLYDTKFHVVILDQESYRLERNGNILFEAKIGEKHHDETTDIDIHINQLEGRAGTYFTLYHINQIYVINDLLERLSVVENGKTSGIVSISLLGPDKREIKDVVSHVLSTYQQQNIEYNNIEAGKSLAFVAEQIPDAKTKVKQAEQELYEYRLTNKTVDLTLKTQQLLNQLLKLEESLNELKLQEPELSRKFKRQHPLYVEFLRKQKDLKAKRTEVELKTAEIPTEQFNVFRLTRDVELNETIYLQLLNRFEGLKIIQAGTSGSIRVIDDTIVQPKAAKPKKPIIVSVSTLAGIVVAMAYIIIRFMLNAALKSPEALEERGLKIFGAIDKSRHQAKLNRQKSRTGELRLLAATNPDDLAVEALRAVRTNLSHTLSTADNNIVMITSAGDGVGKSFIAQNIAALWAQSGHKTLLIDADLRRGKLHQSFGLTVNQGLAEHLAGKAEFDDICRQSKIDNLSFIGRGEISINPSELLMSNGFAKFCQKHNQDYDYIIIDTPSILTVTDAAIIGKLAATSMMVVGKNISQMKQIDLATQRLDLAGVTISGYIFNDPQKNKKQ